MSSISDLMTNDYEFLDHKDNISYAISRMKNEQNSCALVFRNDKLLGTFSPNHMTRISSDLSRTTVEKFTKPVPTLSKEDTIEESVRIMTTTNSTLLPIMEGHKVIGCIKIQDLVRNLTHASINLKVTDLEGKEANYKISEEDSISSALRAMKNSKSNLLIVINKNQEPIDLITKYDIINHTNLFSHRRDWGAKIDQKTRAFSPNHPNTGLLSVSNFIKYRQPHIISADATLEEAIKKMKAKGSLALLVPEKELVITAKKIITALYRNLRNYPMQTYDTYPAPEIIRL